MAHEPMRSWRTVWLRQWCDCGAHRWPCQDRLAERARPPAYWLARISPEQAREAHRRGIGP